MPFIYAFGERNVRQILQQQITTQVLVKRENTNDEQDNLPTVIHEHGA